MAARLVVLVLVLGLSGCVVWDDGPDRAFVDDRPTPPQRLGARSPWYPLQGEQIQLFADYCGWDEAAGQRVVHTEIGDKVRQMVMDADDLIVGTFFLFDNLYADEPAGDYAGELTDLLIAKKTANPSMRIVLILDTFHKGWGYRRSAAVERLLAAGVDIFYSEMLDTRSAMRFDMWEHANEIGRGVNMATGGVLGLGSEVLGHIPIAVPGLTFDGDMITVATIANAAFLKANHRKALVIRRDGAYEALVTSWNPHNPSLLHENHAITVTGPLACYVYEVLREDVRRSIELGEPYVPWPAEGVVYGPEYLHTHLPTLGEAAWRPPDVLPFAGPPRTGPEGAFATEEAIEPILMQWLSEIEPDDRVRIQMFYLARVPVVHAILDAAARTKHPIQILLDPNREGINYPRDGTPNAQVAEYLLTRAQKEGARIEIRWYLTHGEQNHAKAMSITNERTGKYLLTLGSANWTRKNLAGINLENNIFLRGTPEVVGQFNALFDRQWSNGDDGIVYSVAWDDPRYNFHRHGGRDKWAVQRRAAFIFPRSLDKGRPDLLEQELVHW